MVCCSVLWSVVVCYGIDGGDGVVVVCCAVV